MVTMYKPQIRTDDNIPEKLQGHRTLKLTRINDQTYTSYGNLNT